MNDNSEVNDTNPVEYKNNDSVDLNNNKPKMIQKLTSIFKPNFQFSDTLINVLTVSFGVLLATFLNHLVNINNEKKEADEFLKGLYADLKKDHAELVSDLNSFKKSSKGFTYYYKKNTKEEFEKDSIIKHQDFIYNYVLWFPNGGRFEGLKSSGKIYYIENENLRNEILDFYQENAPVLIGITNYYNSQHERLRIYIEESKTTKGIEELLIDPRGKIILLKCISLQNTIIQMYEDTIRKTEKIMNLIKDENE